MYSKENGGRARREGGCRAGFPIGAKFVDSAQIISPSMIKLIVRNADPTLGGKYNNLIIEVVWIKETYSQTNEIRIRGFSSRSSDGKLIVQDGILMSHRKPSFWIYKCRSANA